MEEKEEEEWRGSEAAAAGEERERGEKRNCTDGRRRREENERRLSYTVNPHTLYLPLPSFLFSWGHFLEKLPPISSQRRSGGKATGKPCSKLITCSLFPLPSPPSLSVLSNLPKEGPGLMEQEREARKKKPGWRRRRSEHILPSTKNVCTLLQRAGNYSKKHMGAAEELK